MAKFNGVVTIKLEVTANVEVSAKDEEAAEQKLRLMINAGKFDLSWQPIKGEIPGVEFAEEDQSADVECVEEL